MTTDRVVMQGAARRPSVDDNARERAWHDAPNVEHTETRARPRMAGGKPGGGTCAGWSCGGRTRRRPRGRRPEKRHHRDSEVAAGPRGGAPEAAPGRSTGAPRGSEAVRALGHSARYFVGAWYAAASYQSFVAAERHRVSSRVCPSALAFDLSLVLVVACPWRAA